MTREEAIFYIEELQKTYASMDKKVAEAIDMAIEALQEPKTIIGIDIPYGSDKGIATLFKGKDEKMVLEEVKEIMSVVRCKDCRHSRVYQTDSKGTMQTHCVAFVMSRTVTDDDFCSWGERREK